MLALSLDPSSFGERGNAFSQDLVAQCLALGTDIQKFQDTSGICLRLSTQSALLNRGSQRPCSDLKGKEDGRGLTWERT